MAKVTFVTHSGEKIDVQAETGQSLMQAAYLEGVDGILAECGGSCSCATCHVILDEYWMKQLGEPEALEANMLEFAEGALPTSRLSCQIEVTEQLDGMTVHVGGEAPSRPASQVSQVIEGTESEAARSSDHDIFPWRIRSSFWIQRAMRSLPLYANTILFTGVHWENMKAIGSFPDTRTSLRFARIPPPIPQRRAPFLPAVMIQHLVQCSRPTRHGTTKCAGLSPASSPTIH